MPIRVGVFVKLLENSLVQKLGQTRRDIRRLLKPRQWWHDERDRRLELSVQSVVETAHASVDAPTESIGSFQHRAQNPDRFFDNFSATEALASRAACNSDASKCLSGPLQLISDTILGVVMSPAANADAKHQRDSKHFTLAVGTPSVFFFQWS